MTKTEFQLHFKHRERFEKGAEDYETYASMVKSLEDESLAKLRGHCVAACRLHKTTAPKKIKKAALKLKQKIPWVPDTFKASPTWCGALRREMGVVRDSRGKKLADTKA